jgi:hypothetical protein
MRADDGGRVPVGAEASVPALPRVTSSSAAPVDAGHGGVRPPDVRRLDDGRRPGPRRKRDDEPCPQGHRGFWWRGSGRARRQGRKCVLCRRASTRAAYHRYHSAAARRRRADHRLNGGAT